MAGSKDRKKTGATKQEEFTLKGRSVAITRQGDTEVLEIDGRVEGFYVTEDGYLLKKDVFQHPAKTLREAVERYLAHETAR